MYVSMAVGVAAFASLLVRFSPEVHEEEARRLQAAREEREDLAVPVTA